MTLCVFTPGAASASALTPQDGTVVWPSATADTSEPVSGPFAPHGGYTLHSTQCQLCHSSHGADASGESLLVGGDGGCIFCHGAMTSAGSSIKISSDGPAMEQGAFANSVSTHGSPGSCAEYECHPRSPHGAGVSNYAAARSALLSDDVDPLIDAALRSGASDSIETATLADEWVTGQLGADFVTIDVYQPALDGANAKAVLNPATPAELALGRAIVTGYACMNHGCHINGAFNALSPEATVGEYAVTVAGRRIPNTDNSAAAVAYGLDQLRTRPLAGHGLRPSKGKTAYASCGTCKSCHDATDVRRGDAQSFPHSNVSWRAAEPSQTPSTLEYGYVQTGTDAAWFTVAGSADQVREITTGRTPGEVTQAEGRTFTVAMDGACLKCHRSGQPGNERGVGIDY